VGGTLELTRRTEIVAEYVIGMTRAREGCLRRWVGRRWGLTSLGEEPNVMICYPPRSTVGGEVECRYLEKSGRREKDRFLDR
jgi:hypothetical protein